MDITPHELRLLNFYRASELHGGLILGQVARRARHADLAVQLTRHSAEEVMHALLWTETIVGVGGRVRPVRDTYQSRYLRLVGARTALVDVLALTQVFERRVYRHFTEHLRRRGTHPLVRTTLARMLEEERGHLTWVKAWLDGEGEAGRTLLRRYTELDARVYAQVSDEYGWEEAA